MTGPSRPESAVMLCSGPRSEIETFTRVCL